jgi:hypothetical protein
MGKRRNSSKLPWIIAGVLLSALLILLLLGKVTLPFGAVALEGYTVFGVSNVQVNGQNQLVMTTAMDASARKAYIKLQNNSISDVLRTAGWNASDVLITAEILNQSCGYRIDYLNEIAYSTTAAVTWSCSYCNDVCTTISGNAGSTRYCAAGSTTPRFQKAYINTNEFVPSWAVKLRLEYADGTAIERIVTETNSDYDLGSIGSVHWSGNLLGRVVCGSPSNVVLVRDLNTQVWRKIADSPFYSNYQSAYNSFLYTPNTGYCGSYGDGSLQASLNNCPAFQAKLGASNNANTAIAQMIANYDPQTFTNAYTYTPSQNMVVPVLVWTLNVSQVAIEVPKFAKAMILSISSLPIEETNTTKVNVSVQNVGTATDSFDVSLQACSPGTITMNPSRITIGVGETKTAELLVEGFAGTYQCTVVAAPVNNNAEGRSNSLVTITINKRACPAEFQCCMNSIAYNDRDCKDEITPVNRVYTNAEGNIVYEACLQLKNFTCGQQFNCALTSQEDIIGTCSQIIVTPNPTASVTPTPVNTPTPIPTELPTPTPTVSPSPSVTVINTPSPTPGGSPTPTPVPGGNWFENPLYLLLSLIVIMLAAVLYKVFVVK